MTSPFTRLALSLVTLGSLTVAAPAMAADDNEAGRFEVKVTNLTGGKTSATDYFRGKTHDKLYTAFKPIVAQKVGEVGATRAYTDLIGRYDKVPFVSSQSVDLDDYVTNKSLDGLFHMVGEQEKSIRSNPAARTTDLLKMVFG